MSCTEEPDQIGAAQAIEPDADRSLELGIDRSGIGRLGRLGELVEPASQRPEIERPDVRVGIEVRGPAQLATGGVGDLETLEVERIEVLGQGRVASGLDAGATLGVRLV